jgi:phosphoribosylformylglycinamidine cyclo-ligase
MKLDVNAEMPDLGCKLSEDLLKPTKIYVKAVEALKEKVKIKGMAHITGGGIPGNLPRALPKGVHAAVNEKSWPEQRIFKLIQDNGGVPEDDMRSTFNMGIGFVIVVDEVSAEEALKILDKTGFPSCIIGTVKRGRE